MMCAMAAALVACQSEATDPDSTTPETTAPAATATATAAAKPGECGPQTISADFDGDGNATEVVGHDVVDGAATVRVCFTDGRFGQIPGMGMAEWLQVIDVDSDGRAEIVYGATTAFALGAQLAVWADDDLVVVTVDDGSPLELRAGGDGTFDEIRDQWDAYHAWGCSDLDADGHVDLVTMRAERSVEGYNAILTGWTIDGVAARVVTEASRTLADSPDPVAEVGIPEC
jgi:hypothetical protein